MTVHSKDGKQKTTKLDRIGKLAEEKKETVFNNVFHAVDLDSLRNIDVHSLLKKAKAYSIIGSRMREICTYGSEEGSAEVIQPFYSPV